ncbi:MAG: hypothetical protein ACO1RT_08545 [Planctomycetaceae bacterium]
MIRCSQLTAAAGFLACQLLVIGCGPPAVPISDVDAARELLDSSLAAWKSGRSVEQMRQQAPPVYVAEELWSQGLQLSDYSIDGNGELYGSNVRLHATLKVAGKGGETKDAKVKYLVTTTPALTIAREDR